MSYDIYLRDPKTGKVIEEKEPHAIYGNTYCIENTELWINLTFNYRSYFIEFFGEGGIYNLNGKKSKDTWTLLTEAIKYFTPETREEQMKALKASDDPWAPQRIDAAIAFQKLLNLALRAPDAIWEISG